MSGVIKAIGKAFKAVTKNIKTIAIAAVIVGAVVLTGGAAIGALPALGSILGSIGITGTMAGVLGGAISGIAMGAATGAIGSAITGTNIWKGIKTGALMGGITGGVMGGVGLVSPNGMLSDMGIGSKVSHLQGLVDAGKATQAQIAQLAQMKSGTGVGAADLVKGAPAADLSTKPLQSVDLPASGSPAAIGNPPVSAPGTQAFGAPQTPSIATPGVDAATGNVAVPVTAAPPVNPANGGGSWFNSPGFGQMAGPVVTGLGQALFGAGAAKDATKEQRRIEESYNVDPNSLFHLNGEVNSGLPTPAEKYGYSSGGYYYDPKSGRVLPKG